MVPPRQGETHFMKTDCNTWWGKIESYFVNEATTSTFNLKSLQVAHSGSAILRHRHLKVRQLVER